MDSPAADLLAEQLVQAKKELEEMREQRDELRRRIVLVHKYSSDAPASKRIT